MEKIILLYRIKVGLMNQAPTKAYRKGGLDESSPYGI